MAMDFFEHQDRARKRTALLVVLFGLAVTGIIAATYMAVAVAVTVVRHADAGEEDAAARPITAADLWEPQLLLFVGFGVIAVVALGTSYKLVQLRGGGHVIAEALGGRLIDPGTTDPDDRRVHNIVEEMAIASGTPVPPVYVMDDEDGINAFAAGYLPGDAVVAVTRGCVRQLTRDELQGVIAHEFSHILNGDMRTNIRLMGVIHGILVIGLVGYMVLRSVRYVPVRSSGNKKGGGGAIILVILALGVALLIIGYLGVFFANIIKAAVSRQREFLADASAVQFTRNPNGIAGALTKIGGLAQGSEIRHPEAGEASHMFFGQCFTSMLGSLFATHPPLQERIARIAAGPIETRTPPRPVAGPAPSRPVARPAPGAARSGVSALAAAAAAPAPPPMAREVGQVRPEHIQQASALLAAVPKPIHDAACEPYGARALVYALLLTGDPDIRSRQLQHLAEHADPQVYALTGKLERALAGFTLAHRLSLLDIAVGSLRRLTPGQYQPFMSNVNTLIRADERVELFEWMLHRVLVHHLDQHFNPRPRRAVGRATLASAPTAASVLLSLISYAGQRHKTAAETVFNLGAGRLNMPSLVIIPPDLCKLSRLDEALDQLQRLAAGDKRRLLEAVAACIAADQKVTDMEAALFRGIGAGLDCPVPLMLPGQALV